jgi:hypothetical protein
MLLYDYKPWMPVQEGKREWRGVKKNVYYKER